MQIYCVVIAVSPELRVLRHNLDLLVVSESLPLIIPALENTSSQTHKHTSSTKTFQALFYCESKFYS